jgi:enterochelin esterase-like enzyme
MVETLKPRVDREFRTLRGPEDTAVMGSSMGGLMAFYAIAEYPDIFGQAAAVSMHVALAGPTERVSTMPRPPRTRLRHSGSISRPRK